MKTTVSRYQPLLMIFSAIFGSRSIRVRISFNRLVRIQEFWKYLILEFLYIARASNFKYQFHSKRFPLYKFSPPHIVSISARSTLDFADRQIIKMKITVSSTISDRYQISNSILESQSIRTRARILYGLARLSVRAKRISQTGVCEVTDR